MKKSIHFWILTFLYSCSSNPSSEVPRHINPASTTSSSSNAEFEQGSYQDSNDGTAKNTEQIGKTAIKNKKMVVVNNSAKNGKEETNPLPVPLPVPVPDPPSDHKSLYFVGQDSDSLTDYSQAVKEGRAPKPDGITLYTAIAADDKNLRLAGIPKDSSGKYSISGQSNPTNYGAGEIDFKKSLTQFPNTDLAIGLYLSDNPGCENKPLRAIVGRAKADEILQSSSTDIVPALTQSYHSSIRDLGNFFASLGDISVYLRVGYEFDGLWNCYHPELYKESFRIISTILRDSVKGKKVDVKMVWQSAVWPRPQDAGAYSKQFDFRIGKNDQITPESDPDFGMTHLERWYPGDDYVDQVGLSVFYLNSWKIQWLGSESGALFTPTSAQQAVLKFAKKHRKKVFIAESAPQGYDLDENGKVTVGSIFNGTRSQVTEDALYKNWFEEYFNFIEQYKSEISGFAYINANWQEQPKWKCTPGAQVGLPGGGCESGYWGDTRLQQRPGIVAKFRDFRAKLNGLSPVKVQ